MKEFLSTTLILFLIIDPIGNVPVYLSVLKTVPEERRKKILVRELVVALLVLLIFFFIGKYMMLFLRLTQESICISGGIILFIIALKMIFPYYSSDHHAEYFDNDPVIVPLAVPLVAGPSALAVILLLPQSPFAVLVSNLMALFCAWIISAAILVSSARLYAVLKIKGLMAMERLMGMLLILMAVQMLLDGIKIMLSGIALK